MESIQERQYRLIRERPFTVLAAVPLILVMAAGGAYIFVSLTEGDNLMRSVLVTISVTLPASVLFLTVRKREKREPFPYATRKIAWWVMTGAFSLIALFSVAIVLFADVEWNRKLAVVSALMMCVPSFVFFYGLLRNDTD